MNDVVIYDLGDTISHAQICSKIWLGVLRSADGGYSLLEIMQYKKVEKYVS